MGGFLAAARADKGEERIDDVLTMPVFTGGGTGAGDLDVFPALLSKPLGGSVEGRRPVELGGIGFLVTDDIVIRCKCYLLVRSAITP